MALAMVALVMIAGAASGRAADAPVQLKLSHWVPPSHPLQTAIEDWAADIKAQSGGSISATIFPAEQLGKAFDHYDMARDGIADAAYVSPGYQPGRFPVISLSDLPFNYSDGKAGTAAVDSWYRKYAAREMKDVHYCFAFIQDPGTLFSKTRVTVPTDIKGLKIRPANASIGGFVTVLGGNNVQASAPQSRDLLERGVADGIFFPWGSTVLFGIDKAIRYAINAQFYASTFVWVLNKDKYEAMSPAQRVVIDNHCNTEWAVRFASPWVDFEAAGRDKIRAEPGHEVVDLTAAQLDQWRVAAAPLRDNWVAGVRRTGGDPDAIATEFVAALTAQHAAEQSSARR
ncbi:MAG TPA: TRAP transporter substrate-binding protein [Stellaceae bacterium]|nr:TRAP transporter substrate-binding protein [Stellaceae bacterium]